MRAALILLAALFAGVILLAVIAPEAAPIGRFIPQPSETPVTLLHILFALIVVPIAALFFLIVGGLVVLAIYCTTASPYRAPFCEHRDSIDDYTPEN